MTLLDSYGTAAAARGRALDRGRRQCESQGRKFLLVNESSERTRMGIDTTVNVTFKCLAESDPEYQRS